MLRKKSKTVAMAMNRQQFKARASEYLVGSLGELLKSRMAKSLGWPDGRYVGKWRRESDQLLDRLGLLLETQTIVQKFDRSRVVRESLKECTEDTLSWLGTTIRVVARIAREEDLPNKVPKSSWGSVIRVEEWIEEFKEKVETLLE